MYSLHVCCDSLHRDLFAVTLSMMVSVSYDPCTHDVCCTCRNDVGYFLAMINRWLCCAGFCPVGWRWLGFFFFFFFCFVKETLCLQGSMCMYWPISVVAVSFLFFLFFFNAMNHVQKLLLLLASKNIEFCEWVQNRICCKSKILLRNVKYDSHKLSQLYKIEKKFSSVQSDGSTCVQWCC